jgi:hypothetical protein
MKIQSSYYANAVTICCKTSCLRISRKPALNAPVLPTYIIYTSTIIATIISRGSLRNLLRYPFPETDRMTWRIHRPLCCYTRTSH